MKRYKPQLILRPAGDGYAPSVEMAEDTDGQYIAKKDLDYKIVWFYKKLLYANGPKTTPERREKVQREMLDFIIALMNREI